MLALGIRYLNGFAAATSVEDRSRPEWPPHPARVFMALAAAHFQSGADPDERSALCWLERLERGGETAAPFIVAPDERARAVVKHYVPINDKNDGYTIKNKKIVVFPEVAQIAIRRERQDRVFARAWVENEIVYLYWPDAEPDDTVRDAFARLCAKVARIGHSSSLVQMWVAEPAELPELTWVPDEQRATIRLRITVPGTLEYLEQQFNAAKVEDFAALRVAEADPSDKKAQREAQRRLKAEYPNGAPPRRRPNLSIYHGYARPAPDRSEQAPGSLFSPHLITFALQPIETPYRHLDLQSVLAAGQRWREALLANSDDAAPAIRSVLSGHDADGAPLKDAHLAFLPLAFVAHEHADGHLLGIAVTLPSEFQGEHRREVLRILSRVSELKLGRLGRWRLEHLTAARPPINLRGETWTAYPDGTTHWATVTPIAFDQHPKVTDRAAYEREVAAMIAECCRRIDLPKPREVIVTAVSAHHGAPPAHSFPRLQRKDGTQRRHCHAILVFAEPVCGPVLLGAGRFRGYGVCRPLLAGIGSGSQ
jgi:CRISPR-associated protein Csb2